MKKILCIGIVLVFAVCAFMPFINAQNTNVSIASETKNEISSAVFTEYLVPSSTSAPDGIAMSNSGLVYFIEIKTNKIGKMTEAGSFTEYTIPTANSNPSAGIAINVNGTVFFNEFRGNKVGKMTPTGTFTEYTVPTAACGVGSIAINSNGTIFFCEHDGNKIGKMTESGSFKEYSLPSGNCDPMGLAINSNGTIFFAQEWTNKIGRMTESGTFLSSYTTSSPAGCMAINSNGTIFFTMPYANKIGKLRESGSLTEYTVPTPNSLPVGIAIGSNGLIYFTQNQGNKIGRMSESGSFAEYTVPTAGSIPACITINSNGTIFFTEYNGNKIGKIDGAQQLSMIIIEPSGGEIFIEGQVENIFWGIKYGNPPYKVYVNFTTDRGITWTPIGSTTQQIEGFGSMSWTVPHIDDRYANTNAELQVYINIVVLDNKTRNEATMEDSNNFTVETINATPEAGSVIFIAIAGITLISIRGRKMMWHL